MALLNVNANIDVSNDVHALSRGTSRYIDRLKSAVSRKSSYEAAKSMKKWMQLAMSCNFHDIRLQGPTDDEVRAFQEHNLSDLALYYAAMSGRMLDAINRRLGGKIFIKFSDNLFDERMEGDMDVDQATSGVTMMIRSARRMAKAHISNQSSIIRVETLQGEDIGLVIKLRADHFAMQSVQSLEDLPGRLINTSRLYRIARLFFGLARLTWRGCYIHGTRHDLSAISRSCEFQRDETAVMNVSIQDSEVVLKLTTLKRTSQSNQHKAWISNWNKDFKRFSQTVEFYVRAPPRMRVLLTTCAALVYNIEIGQNCEADILYQQLKTLSDLSYHEESSDSDDDDEIKNGSESKTIDESGLIKECFYVSTSAMLLSSVRNRIFCELEIWRQVHLGDAPEFESCSVEKRLGNRGIEGQVTHTEVNSKFMRLALSKLNSYDFGQTVEHFDFLPVADTKRFNALCDEYPYESLGFLTPELQTDHAHKIIE